MSSRTGRAPRRSAGSVSAGDVRGFGWPEAVALPEAHCRVLHPAYVRLAGRRAPCRSGMRRRAAFAFITSSGAAITGACAGVGGLAILPSCPRSGPGSCRFRTRIRRRRNGPGRRRDRMRSPPAGGRLVPGRLHASPRLSAQGARIAICETPRYPTLPSAGGLPPSGDTIRCNTEVLSQVRSPGLTPGIDHRHACPPPCNHRRCGA